MPTRRTPRTSTRVRRTSPRQGPRAPTHLVERMVVAVIGVANAYFDRLLRQIEPELQHRFGGKRSDADPFPVAPVGGQISLGEQFLKVTFKLVDRQAADDLARVAPISSESVLPNAIALEKKWIHTNTELIQLEARARQEIRNIIEGPLRAGATVDEVRKKIEGRLGVVRSRAEFIARDQTLKLYGQIQEQRQTAAGIEEYTWSTSEDERVRGNPDGLYPNSQSDHFHLEGTVQRWDSAPVVDAKTGRTAHPGADFQCRCAAIPILPDGDLEEQESPAEPADIEPTPPENDLEPLPANEVELASETEASPFESAAELASEAAEETAVPAPLPRPPLLAPSLVDRAQALTADYRVAAGVTDETQEHVLSALEQVRLPNAAPLTQIEIQSARELAVDVGGMVVQAGGYYDPADGTLHLASAPEVLALPLSDRNFSTGDVAKTSREAMGRLVAHEYAHHLHETALGTVDRILRDGYERLAPLAARTLAANRSRRVQSGGAPEGAVTVYGTENHAEFWAEAFTAYHFDRDWMRAHKRPALELVESVLRLLL